MPTRDAMWQLGTHAFCARPIRQPVRRLGGSADGSVATGRLRLHGRSAPGYSTRSSETGAIVALRIRADDRTELLGLAESALDTNSWLKAVC